MKKYLLIAASLLLCLPLAAAVQKVSLNSDGRVAAWQLRAQDEVTDPDGPAGKNPGDGEVKQKRSTAVAGLSYRPG